MALTNVIPLLPEGGNGPPQKKLKDDLLWGVTAIAQELGLTERQTYHMLMKAELPAKKVSGRWMASKSKLRAYLIDD
ncbi:hypothetical protein ELH77_19075 [Rhizobium ruizarguesonis]|uniref:hypothetical protein n=1 Tax=Rhizobium ruizarguesonis TaxID=2081791 RepID=UPI00103015F3|nr:hypothetical protein [Rhizobium ruizarguesonis]TAZ20709.1 hypothetical protein ELH77_19075 [Rhizobium ruizarguesonis]